MAIVSFPDLRTWAIYDRAIYSLVPSPYSQTRQAIWEWSQHCAAWDATISMSLTGGHPTTIYCGLIPWALVVSSHACMIVYQSFMPLIYMVIFIRNLDTLCSYQSVSLTDKHNCVHDILQLTLPHSQVCSSPFFFPVAYCTYKIKKLNIATNWLGSMIISLLLTKLNEQSTSKWSSSSIN